MSRVFTKIRPAALAVSLLIAAHAHAAGTGTIADGTGNISKDGTTTTVTQSTNKLIINWDNMDVARNETLNFKQRSSTAAVLNRVNSLDPTTILGSLNANGRVFIVNPNGVVVGPSGRINVGALFASSLNISDEDFRANNLNFSGGGQGRVANYGKITAKESVGLIGSKTVENLGTITSSGGDVVMASGDDITLEFADSHLEAKLNKGSLEALVNNGGFIKTDDGNITLTAWARDSVVRSVVNNTGTLEASSLSRDESSKQNYPLYGRVNLVAGKSDYDSNGQSTYVPGGPWPFAVIGGDVTAGGSISAENVQLWGATVTVDGTLLVNYTLRAIGSHVSTTDRAWIETGNLWSSGFGIYDWSRGNFIYSPGGAPNILEI
ncbi:filamentous hemagglutinin N-terminal domain-containing protein [Trinickia sp. YCB016]